MVRIPAPDLSTNHPHHSNRLRVVTYNVHKCRGVDGRVRPDRIARVLSEIDADVVGLQEVVSIEHGRADHHQARYLADNLGYSCELGENRRHRGGAYGNVLLSRKHIRHARNHDISVPGRERRGCLEAEIEWRAGATIQIFNLHLGTAFFERRLQARQLFGGEIFRREDVPAHSIVLGDFNEWTRGLASRMFRTHFETAHNHMHRARTFPGMMPLLRLDHIYFDRKLRLESVRIHRSAASLVASDHLPVVAEFSLPEPSLEMTASGCNSRNCSMLPLLHSK